MNVKRFENLDELSGFNNKLMISALPQLKLAAYNSNDVDDGTFERIGASHKKETDIKSLISDGSIGVCYYCYGDYLYSTSDTYNGYVTQTININDDNGNVIKFGCKPYNNNDLHDEMYFWKFITLDNYDEKAKLMVYDENGNRVNVHDYTPSIMKTPICLFGTYNEAEGATPDNYISLGYLGALQQYGYTAGVRYSVKEIIITDRNPDGTRSETHHLVPARDSNGNILLYDTVTESKYYPYNGTLNIM